MELYLLNTIDGLRPLYPNDYEEKRKLKLGQTYKATVTVPRNIRFHNKYFKLIDVAWEFLNERQREAFHNNREGFRHTIEIAAGACNKVWSISRGEWIEEAKSISFASMDEEEFSQLYSNILDIVFRMFVTTEHREQFLNVIKDF